MKYMFISVFLLLIPLTAAECLSSDGTSIAQLIPQSDTRFTGLRALGLGYDERSRALRDEVYNYDVLDLVPNEIDSRDCTFIGSSQIETMDDSIDIGFGISSGDLFEFNTFFGLNETNTVTMFTGYYACAFMRTSATVGINRNEATVGEDLLRRANENLLNTPDAVYSRYGTQYIDEVTYGALYTVAIRFQTTDENLLREWAFGLDFSVPIPMAAISFTSDFEIRNRDTFQRTDTSVTIRQTSRGFRLSESEFPSETAFEEFLNNPQSTIDRIEVNLQNFEETGAPLQGQFDMNLPVDVVSDLVLNSDITPITFALAGFGSIEELPINDLIDNQCEVLKRNLEAAREYRKMLNGFRSELAIAARDVLDSFGIERSSRQASTYSFALQIIDDDILEILHNLDDYEIQTPQYIIGTEIEGHTCGLGDATLNEISARVSDVVGATDTATVAQVFEGRECQFDGIVVDAGLIPMIKLFNDAGCPIDGSPAPRRQRSIITSRLSDLIDDSRMNIRELVIIGGLVVVADGAIERRVRGVRFDEDRNVFGLGWIRRNIRDEIVTIDNTCTLIRENDFVETELGVGQVRGFTCVSTSGCLQNQRVDTRNIRRQLANGRLNVEIISTSSRQLFRSNEVLRIARPVTSIPPRQSVDVREIPCTVNSRCREAQGTCYRDIECDSGLMCHPGTSRHPDYVYENDALSFCVPFERIRASARNVCSPDALCDDGEGSCNSNADCQGSLQCRDVRNNPAYDLGNDILQKICVRPQTPFDPENCECCGETSRCDHLKLQAGDGHCMNHDHCAEGLTCVPNSCGLFRGFNSRNEFSESDSCCMDLRGHQRRDDLTDQEGFEGVRMFDIDGEPDFDTRANICAGECAKEERCVFWTAATDSNGCWLWQNPGNVFARARSRFQKNRVSYPKFAYGETPYGCPKGFVHTLGDDFSLSLYHGQLRCKKKPADKVCGHGMRYERRALQGEFDTSSVERDISVCRKQCAGCGAFRYNTDTSECAIFHRLDITLSDRISQVDEIVCVYDSEQAGERKVATNICLSPRSLTTSFSMATSGRILSASLTHRSGEVKCLERSVEECPSTRGRFTRVLGTPGHCDCCLHGSSCNRCPNGFHNSGAGQSCSGRGEFRCNSRGEVHAERSATWACDATERAQIVLETDTHTIHFDDFNTQVNADVLTSGQQDHGFVSQTINVRYTNPTDAKFVFADGEICFDVQLVIDDSQVAETPEATCYCDTPGAGTAGFNRMTCTNGDVHHCAFEEECFASAGFPFSARAQGCRIPRVKRSEIQYHSTECNVHGSLDTLSKHNVVCPDGYALSAWKVNTCSNGLGVRRIRDHARCRNHIWLDIKTISAEQCADVVRNDPRCQGTNLIQWAERSDRNCGCFMRDESGPSRHCQFPSGQVEDDTPNVYEFFGIQVDYECVPVQEVSREERHSSCESVINEPLIFLDRQRFHCGENQVLKEFRLTSNGCSGTDKRFTYVCSTNAEEQNEYSVPSRCIPTVGAWTDALSSTSARCGPGDLMTGFSFPRCDGGSHRMIAECARRTEGYEPVQAGEVVCSWEGTINGEAPSAGGNAVNCGRICDSRADCNSFTLCGDTCFFTGDAYTNDEPWTFCRNDRVETCRSYRNTNFIL